MAKANEVYSSGQFLTASLTHFTVGTGDTVVSVAKAAAATALAASDAAPADAALLAASVTAAAAYVTAKQAKIKELVEATSMRATVVILGAGEDEYRIAVENNGAWNDDAVADDPASLSLALGGTWTVADFAY